MRSFGAGNCKLLCEEVAGACCKVDLSSRRSGGMGGGWEIGGITRRNEDNPCMKKSYRAPSHKI